MKKENCPFCGHRWIRKSSESMIECPNCRTEYFVQLKQEFEDEAEVGEEEETDAEEF